MRALLVLLAACAAVPASAQTIAITGGTVAIGDGSQPIPNGTVVIRDGRVVAAGADVAVPAGATRVDAQGKWVAAGLVAGFSNLGLADADGVERKQRHFRQGLALCRGDRRGAGDQHAIGGHPDRTRGRRHPGDRLAGHGGVDLRRSRRGDRPGRGRRSRHPAARLSICRTWRGRGESGRRQPPCRLCAVPRGAGPGEGLSPQPGGVRRARKGFADQARRRGGLARRARRPHAAARPCRARDRHPVGAVAQDRLSRHQAGAGRRQRGLDGGAEDRRRACAGDRGGAWSTCPRRSSGSLRPKAMSAG